MNGKTDFRVPRSRAFQTHDDLRAEILSALEPLLFGSMDAGYTVRREFEQAFAAAMQQPHAVAVHSGTLGLFLALRACGVQAGDEVITVGNSDISTTAAIRHCGAVPVLCDVLEMDYTIDPQWVEQLITARTRAILPVDLYGHPADVKTLRVLADRYGLKIVEDAALATGAYDYGSPVGAHADVTVFSFAPFKPLGSVGNGAAVVTNDAEIAHRLQLLVYYGHALDSSDIPSGHQCYVDEGYNAPLDTLQAALLSVKLPHLPAWTQKRREIAQAYEAGLADLPVRCPVFRVESAPTFRAYTIRVPRRRQEVYQHLRAAGIEVVLHYVPPIYKHPVYGGGLLGSEALPVTDRLADELLCLPITPELTEDDIAHTLAALRAALAG